jgi:NAD(P)-dependent dehydrogenase (short-subunit alcohol dehydrogenase family)
VGRLSEKKDAFFEETSTASPAGRIGTLENIAQAVVFAMINTFMTGVSLAIDGAAARVSGPVLSLCGPSSQPRASHLGVWRSG